MKFKRIFTTLFIFIFFINNIACNKDDNNDNSKEDHQNDFQGAPTELPIGYVLAYNRENYPIFYWIKNSYSGWYKNSNDTRSKTRIITPYNYVKTGENTANFIFSATQLINGPIKKRVFHFEGTLTFSSPTECSFKGTYEYTADGIYKGVYEEVAKSLILLKADLYPSLK